MVENTVLNEYTVVEEGLNKQDFLNASDALLDIVDRVIARGEVTQSSKDSCVTLFGPYEVISLAHNPGEEDSPMEPVLLSFVFSEFYKITFEMKQDYPELRVFSLQRPKDLEEFFIEKPIHEVTLCLDKLYQHLETEQQYIFTHEDCLLENTNYYRLLTENLTLLEMMKSYQEHEIEKYFKDSIKNLGKSNSYPAASPYEILVKSNSEKDELK